MASTRTTALTSFGLGVALTIAGATLTADLNLGGNDISNVATISVTGTATGGRLEVRPSTGSGIVRIRSNTTGTATGGFLCIEDLTGTVDICYSSGGRLDCDTDTNSRCN